MSAPMQRGLGTWIAVLLVAGVVAAGTVERDAPAATGAGGGRRSSSSSTTGSTAVAPGSLPVDPTATTTATGGTDATTPTTAGPASGWRRNPTGPVAPPSPLVGQYQADGSIRAATVDLASGTAVPSSLPASPVDGWAPPGDGRRVVVNDGFRPEPMLDGCALAGCLYGEPSFPRPSGITVVQPDGTPVALSLLDRMDIEPEWSPAGDAIAFISREAEAEAAFFFKVKVMRPDGGLIGYVTPPGASDTSFTYAPNGTAIAVFRPHPYERDGDVIIVSLIDGSQQTIASGRFAELAWSPDGTMIAAVGGRDLWVLPTDGRPPLQLTNDATGDVTSQTYCGASGGFAASVHTPKWSSDGQLAYVTNHEHVEDLGTTYDIAVADLSGGGADRVVLRSPPATCGDQPGELVHAPATVLLGWA